MLVGSKLHFTESNISQKTSLNSSNEHFDKETLATEEPLNDFYCVTAFLILVIGL